MIAQTVLHWDASSSIWIWWRFWINTHTNCDLVHCTVSRFKLKSSQQGIVWWIDKFSRRVLRMYLWWKFWWFNLANHAWLTKFAKLLATKLSCWILIIYVTHKWNHLFAVIHTRRQDNEEYQLTRCVQFLRFNYAKPVKIKFEEV